MKKRIGKKRIALFLSVALIGGLFSSGWTNERTVYAEDTVIKNDETGIPDANFYENLLKNYDSNADGVLTKEEATAVTRIFLSDCGIESMKGIEYFTELEQLDVSNNRITDLTGVSELSKLTSLNLNNTQITDVSCIHDMPALKSLYLNNNELTNLNGMSGLPALSELYLYGNEFTQVPSFSRFPLLSTLNMNANKLTDLSELSNLSELSRLYLKNNQLEEINGLNNLPMLKYLDLSNNEIESINGLNNLPVLETLVLNGNNLKNVSGINQFPLTRLELSNNQLSDLSGLTGMSSLGSLYLSGNHLKSTEEISSLSSLEYLDLSCNQLTDVSGLSDLQLLFEVNLSNNQITELNLGVMRELYGINLNYNQITDVSCLGAMPNLYEVELSYNGITDLNAININKLRNVFALYLVDNNITDLSALKGMHNIRILNLHKNFISDLSPLEGMSFDQLILGKNMISDIRQITMLSDCRKLNLSENRIAEIPDDFKDWALVKKFMAEPAYYDGRDRGFLFMIDHNKVTLEEAKEKIPEELLHATYTAYNSDEEYTWIEQQKFVGSSQEDTGTSIASGDLNIDFGGSFVEEKALSEADKNYLIDMMHWNSGDMNVDVLSQDASFTFDWVEATLPQESIISVELKGFNFERDEDGGLSLKKVERIAYQNMESGNYFGKSGIDLTNSNLFANLSEQMFAYDYVLLLINCDKQDSGMYRIKGYHVIFDGKDSIFELSDVEEEVAPEDTTPDYVVDLTSGSAVVTEEEFAQLLEKNIENDIVIHSNNDVTFTFAKGTMGAVEGMTEYDFSTTITTEYAQVEKLPTYITEDKFVSMIDFNYSGMLPALCYIKFYVGTEWAGKTLLYGEFKDNGSFVKSQSAVVDEEGYLTIKQGHCSRYLLLDMGESALGDVNLDAAINLIDAQEALKIALGIGTPSATAIKNADVDENGDVNLKDAQQILKYALGIITVFEVTVF